MAQNQQASATRQVAMTSQERKRQAIKGHSRWSLWLRWRNQCRVRKPSMGTELNSTHEPPHGPDVPTSIRIAIRARRTPQDSACHDQERIRRCPLHAQPPQNKILSTLIIRMPRKQIPADPQRPLPAQSMMITDRSPSSTRRDRRGAVRSGRNIPTMLCISFVSGMAGSMTMAKPSAPSF